MSILSLVLALFMGGDVPSGPMAGDKLAAFKANGFSGAQEGKEFDLVKDSEGKPTLIVVVHEITRPTFQLIKAVDGYAAKEEKLATHFVWLGEKEKTEAYLKRAKDSLGIQSPMSVALEKEGPMTWGLNDRAKVTIIVAKEGKVLSNFAFSDPNATNARAVIAAVAKALGKEGLRK